MHLALLAREMWKQQFKKAFCFLSKLSHYAAPGLLEQHFCHWISNMKICENSIVPQNVILGSLERAKPAELILRYRGRPSLRSHYICSTRSSLRSPTDKSRRGRKSKNVRSIVVVKNVPAESSRKNNEDTNHCIWKWAINSQKTCTSKTTLLMSRLSLQ